MVAEYQRHRHAHTLKHFHKRADGLFAGGLGEAAVTGNVVAGEHDQVGLILFDGMLDETGGEVGEQHIILNIREIQHAEAAVRIHVQVRAVGGRCGCSPGGHADQRQHDKA